MKRATKRSQTAAEPNPRKPRYTVSDLAFNSDTHPNWIRLAHAIHEIATNPATPCDIYNSMMDCLNSASSDLWGDLMKSPEVILRILIIMAAQEKETQKE